MATTAPKLECERIRLPMVCICGNVPRDLPEDTPKEERDRIREENRAKAKAVADELLTKAYALLTHSPDHPCTAENFLSYAVGDLNWSYSAEFKCAVDQWYGAYAEVKKYIECEHGEGDCPDEPECFVSEWQPILHVTTECDILEHGLAALVIWFYENRKANGDDE